MKRKSPTQKQLNIKSGNLVEYTTDKGSTIICTATSEPWQLGHGEWVIKLAQFSGGMMLTRCKPLDFKPAIDTTTL